MDYTSIKVGQLPTEEISGSDFIPHEVNGLLKKATITDLAAFIGANDAVGFRAVSVPNGGTLPTTDTQEFILVGPGTYNNVGGGSTITVTEELNAIVSNGTYWFVGVEIPIDAPPGNAVWGEIVGTLSNQTDLQSLLNLKADLVAGKVPSSQLPSYVDDVVEVADFAALPVSGETGKIYVTLDNNKIYRWSGSVYIEIAANNAIWGAITGTLSNQTDLQNALNTKALKTTTISTTSPLFGGGDLSGDLTLFIQEANSVSSGYLTYTDWRTFNEKANDDEVVHLTGNETISGTKSFTDNGSSSSIYCNVTSTNGVGISIDTSSTNGSGIYSTNTSSGIGIESYNTVAGAGIYSTNSGNGMGIGSYNSSTGYGIYSTNTGNGRGIFCENTSTGIGVFLSNSGSGKNLLLNNTAPATGMPFTVQKGGTDVATISDAGAGVFSSTVQASAFRLSGMTAGSGALYWTSDRVTLANYNATGTVVIEATGGDYYATFGGSTYKNDFVGTGRFTGNLTGSSADFSGNVSINSSSLNFGGTGTYAGTDPSIYRVGSGVNDLAFAIGSSERMRITSDGKVGIGTDNPSNKLHVYSTLPRIIADTSSNYSVFNLYQAGSEKGAFYLENSNKQIILEANGDNTYTLNFRTGGSERMRITSDGKVGIGTNNPQDKFVISNAGAHGLEFTANATFNINLASYNRATSAYIPMNFDASKFSFQQGDVLVGWTGGTYNDPVYNNVRGISLRGINNSPAVIVNNEGIAAYFGRNGTTGNLINFNYNGATTVGSISISTSSTSYNTSSDYRLKEDLQPMVGSLERLQQLKPVNFAWKIDGKRVDGFIAHELAEVIPEAVTGEKDATEEVEVTPAVLDEEGNVIEEAVFETRDVYQGIDQSKIVPLLVAAMQDLKAEIELLKAK